MSAACELVAVAVTVVVDVDEKAVVQAPPKPTAGGVIVAKHGFR